ncbi:hypothetical protein AKO1_003115 [Acrasis kona]|uniref:Uncharacterized protein n=1 Tax=Acrasis kona TaxID=1008807 RepID=A0AAW2Z7V8_9EUKA
MNCEKPKNSKYGAIASFGAKQVHLCDPVHHHKSIVTRQEVNEKYKSYCIAWPHDEPTSTKCHYCASPSHEFLKVKARTGATNPASFFCKKKCVIKWFTNTSATKWQNWVNNKSNDNIVDIEAELSD